MVGEQFEIYLSKMAKTVYKSSMVGEKFEIYSSQMAKIVFKSGKSGLLAKNQGKKRLKNSKSEKIRKSGPLGALQYYRVYVGFST